MKKFHPCATLLNVKRHYPVAVSGEISLNIKQFSRAKVLWQCIKGNTIGDTVVIAGNHFLFLSFIIKN